MEQRVRQDLDRNGFAKIPPELFHLDSNTVQLLRSELDRLFFQEMYEIGVYPDEIHWRSGISHEYATKEICNAWKASRIIAKVVCSEALGRLACQLATNWNSTRLGQDDVLDKPANQQQQEQGGGSIGFHQDGTYISDNFIVNSADQASTNNDTLTTTSLTFWMALDDADVENGALQYAPGSHQWSQNSLNHNHNNNNESKDNKKSVAMDVSAASFHCAKDPYASLRRAAQDAGVDPESAVNSVQNVTVPAGHVIVHHDRVWHGSGPNKSSNRRRRALVAHLIDGSVKWRTSSPPHYIYGRYYIRGEKIPREDFFPITYSCVANKETKRTVWLDEYCNNGRKIDDNEMQ